MRCQRPAAACVAQFDSRLRHRRARLMEDSVWLRFDSPLTIVKS
jgi:hypothetical protein